MVIGIVLGVLLGLAAASVAAFWARARLQESVAAEREAAAQAMLVSVAAERDAAVQAALASVSAERDAVVRSAVDTVLAVANEKLTDHRDTTERSLDLRTRSFEQQVSGMNDELRRVQELLGQLGRERAQQHGQVVQSLEQTAQQSRALAETTQQLRRALSNARARGQWGERMADDVLRAAGFVEGLNYRKQTAIDGGSIPDVTFLLPHDRVLHMDVKFPIDNYLRHLEAAELAATDPSAAAQAEATRAQFLRDVRQRVKEITGRAYVDPDTTLGYVLLFIPNEAVYAFVHEHDPGLLDAALARQVVLCSPLTLFAVLGVVRQAVDSVELARTSDEILQCLGRFRGQWEKFSEQVDRLGKQFATANRTYDELAGTRRRQLQRTLDEVEQLRAARGMSSPAPERAAPPAGPMPDPGPHDEVVEARGADRDDPPGPHPWPEPPPADDVALAVGGESYPAPGRAGTPRRRPTRLRPVRGR